MSGHIEQDVDTNSAEFKHGVEAGLTDRKQSSTPLFMSDSPEGNKGNPQDEKDESGSSGLLTIPGEVGLKSRFEQLVCSVSVNTVNN